MLILPDAPPIINIGTHVSLYAGTVPRGASEGNAHHLFPVAIREHVPILKGSRERDHITGRARESRYVSRPVAAVMIQFTVDRRSICYHFFA
jgi:hypothetical protein